MGDVEDVVLHVLAVDEELALLLAGYPADAEPLMLADGVVEHAHVAPHHLAGLALDDVPGGGREIIGQELAEVPLADEADPGRVLLVHDGFQIELVGDLPDLGLGYVRKREKAGIYLLFAEETKEVRLVLVSILGLHYVDVAVLRLCFAGVMPHRDLLIAVIEGELERLSERMDEVSGMDVSPEEKMLRLIYTHLDMIKETVSRNGNLRAEFFRNIWLVEKVRRAFDEEEKNILVRVLEEGNRDGSFHVSHVPFTAEIIHYAVKGLEVPYIYDRLGEGLDEEQSRAVVVELVRRFLGIKTNLSTN